MAEGRKRMRTVTGEKKPGDVFRQAKRRMYRSAALTLASFILASSALWLGVSFGWLGSPSQNVDAGGTGVTSVGVAATTGYDVYKYDETDINQNGDFDEGININSNLITMNLYDRILLGRNDRTPLILRAQLSPGYATEIQAGKSVMLTISCASASTEPEEYDIDGDGTSETVHWLSNVIGVIADYIPEIVENIESGTIPLDEYDQPYKSDDDYIYHAAINHLKSLDENTGFKFNFVTGMSEGSPEYTGDVQQKSAELELNMSNARASNGYYYIYLLIDYEPTLISDYMQANNMEIQIGSETDSNYKFEDIFDISAVVVD